MEAGGGGSVGGAGGVPRLPTDYPRPPSGWNTFSQAAQVVLSRWDIIRTGLAEQWGGARSRAAYEHFVDDLMMNLDEQWREGADVHVDTLDVFIIEFLEKDFNLDFEDDRCVTEVSLVIQDLYRRCAAGDLTTAQEVIASIDKVPALGQRVIAGAAGDDDDSDDESVEEVEEGGGAAGGGGGGGARRHVVDEDGWETIPVKKGGASGGGGGAAPAVAGGGSSGAAAPPAPGPSSMEEEHRD